MRLSALLWALVCLVSAVRSDAAVPFAVNQQGLLVDTAGVPMNGSVDLFFRVWAHPTSTAPADLVYQELHLDRPVVDGVYEAVLGTGSFPAPAFSPALFAAPDRWLEIQVEAETLTPRQRIVSVPYALQAQVCELAAQADDAQTLNGFDENSFQSVVTGTCPAGQSIRAIAPNGAVTCEVDDVGTGDITGVTAGTGLAGGAASGNATLSIASGGVVSTLIADGTITNADVAAAAAIAPTKIAGIAATRTFVDEMDFNGTLYIVTANGGRVGIDNDLPQEKLDVDGNVRAVDFRFATARTGYATVAGIAFIPEAEGWNYHSLGGARYSFDHTDFTASIQLPHGATLTELRCDLYDADPAEFVTTRLYRAGTGGTAQQLALVSTSSGPDTGEIEVAQSFTHLVNNQGGAYYLYANLEGAATRISYCQIAYTEMGP
jgi:hypothetical protein